SIDTTPPSIGGGKVRADISTKALNLSAWITNQGIALKTSSGNIATGCQDVGAGMTLPKNGDDNDLKGLTACAKRLKNARAEFKEETQVTITANPGIDYKTVIDVMDALRSDGEEELFPEVHFGVARGAAGLPPRPAAGSRKPQSSPPTLPPAKPTTSDRAHPRATS